MDNDSFVGNKEEKKRVQLRWRTGEMSMEVVESFSHLQVAGRVLVCVMDQAHRLLLLRLFFVVVHQRTLIELRPSQARELRNH